MDTASTDTPSYDALAARQRRLHRLGHLQSLATWDRMTMMPSGRGPAAARAAAQTELAALLQAMRDDPAFDEHYARARAEPLAPAQRRNFEWLEREHVKARAVPAALAARLEALEQTAGTAWRDARVRNDWSTFADALVPLVAAVRERAERLGDAQGIGRYDALIDGYEPGLRHDRIGRLFADVGGWLPTLVATARARQHDRAPVEPVGPFPVDAQRRLCERVMALLGFDFAAGRLDVSAHPFTGGVAEDVRLTTRFGEASFLPSLIATMHETGHACYQQHLPREWLGQPLGGPHSAALHEGQALTFERQLAPSEAFARVLAPMLADAFGAQPAFEAENLTMLMRRVRPGPIRVEADELTYPAHVILRVEIEHALIEGAIGVDDVPAWWDERMSKLLDIDTRGAYAEGPLQDIHWSQGMFGYFPAYLLGAMVAAQCMEAIRRDMPDLDARVAGGDVACVGGWLDERIWSRGAMLGLDELMTEATGHGLGSEALRRHFERRYAAPA